MPKLYVLEDSIAEFFRENTATTRETCDSIARDLIDDPVVAVPIQGEYSYTVTAGPDQNTIVQFRAQTSVLDVDKVELARQIHPQFVPKFRYHNDIGEDRPLFIYTIDKVPGIPQVIASFDKKASDLRLNAVGDFARFFAQTWNSPQFLSTVETSRLESKIQQKLNILLAELPGRFTQTLTLLHAQYLSLLFHGDHPLVLAHGDLSGLNVMVDPESLHVTGFIDWADAEIAPFGLALYGFLNIVGKMDSTGWHYHNNHQEMIAQFWAIFEHEIGSLSKAKKNVIRAACIIGIFLRHGFMEDGGDKNTVATEDADCMKYLDGWLGIGSSGNDLLCIQ